MQNPLIVLVGFSGAGKTELSKRLLKSVPRLKHIRSCTTRDRRIAEGEPTDAYHFMTRARFQAHVAAGHFVEYDELDGNLYGRRYEDFLPLQENPCIADMTEAGIAALQMRPALFRMVCIRIIPVGKLTRERDAARIAEDVARAQIPIRIDYEVLNNHEHSDGLHDAERSLRDIVERAIRKQD